MRGLEGVVSEVEADMGGGERTALGARVEDYCGVGSVGGRRRGKSDGVSISTA